jgi:malonate transporter
MLRIGQWKRGSAILAAMLSILGALAPIFLLILLGWAIRRCGFVAESFWVSAEKLTYFVLFPSLLVANLAEAQLAGLPVAAVAGAQGLAILAVAGLVSGAGRLGWRAGLEGPGYSSLFQAAIRPNTYVGFAAAASLFGAAGVTLTAVCVALVVPLVNLLCVLALLHWGGQGRQTGWRMLVPVLKNPLISACLIGIGLNAGGIGLPPVIGPLLKILGQAALALGLLAVGAGLEPAAIRSGGRPLAVAGALKLVAMPLLAGGLAVAFGLSGTALAVSVLYAGLPVAPNAYMLARQMGGDARLMAAMISLTTLLAGATLPVWVTLVQGW